MKRIFLSTVAVIALATGAQAADLPIYEPAPVIAPVPAGYTWTGFYVGLHGGYAFGDDDDGRLLFDTDLDGDFDDTVISGGVDAFGDRYESDFDDGIDVGIRSGYDYQFGSFLVGGLVDLSYVDLEDSTTGTSSTPADYTFERELDWLGTARLRAGFAADRLLVYATGGLAYGNLEYSYNDTSGADEVDVGSDDDDAWGYTVGAGVEALVTSRFSVGLEYLYTDLDTDDHTIRLAGPGGPGGPFGDGTDIRTNNDEFDFHTVRLTASYRFGGGM